MIAANNINESDLFRKAFTAISKAAIPHMDDDAYFSDLLYDAAQAAQLAEGERFYLLVRNLGTNVYAYPDDAVDSAKTNGGRVVLRVMRKKFDSFEVTLCCTLAESHGTWDDLLAAEGTTPDECGFDMNNRAFLTVSDVDFVGRFLDELVRQHGNTNGTIDTCRDHFANQPDRTSTQRVADALIALANDTDVLIVPSEEI